MPSEDSSTNVEVLEYIHARIGVLTCEDWGRGKVGLQTSYVWFAY